MSKRYPGGILRKTPQTPTQTSAQGVWDMASVTQAVKENNWPIAGVPDPISKSLRFRSSASAYLNRTPASAGNRKTWTWSAWVKRGAIGSGVNGNLFQGGTTSSDTGSTSLSFAVDKLYVQGYSTNWIITNAVYRDPSAWYHVVLAMDTTQATATNRLKLYVNGSEVSYGTYNNLTQNTDYGINQAASHVIGQSIASFGGGYFDGYMTEVYFIDGQALTPSSFGSTNDQTGVWQPIAYTGTYGTNGFYLPFSNTASTATLGYDFSGNSNNWTTNNISLTSGSTYDSMVDVPTQWIPYNTAGDTGALFRGNYAVLNPLKTNSSTCTLSDGNLKATFPSGSAGGIAMSTIGVSSGKWYWELTVGGTDGATQPKSGVIPASTFTETASSIDVASYGYVYGRDGDKTILGTKSAYGASFTTNDIIGYALDMDAGTLVCYKNNTSQGTLASGISGSMSPALTAYNGYSETINFGQRPFAYTPPSGFKTLCTTNLTTPTIGATAATTADKYMDVTLYTGNGAASGRNITTSTSPNLAWIKSRSLVANHFLFDSVRGATNVLGSNQTIAEYSNSDFGLGTNQFTVGDNGGSDDYNPNKNAATYVAWLWAAGGTGVTNTAGSITSTVSANTTAGFSIVTYTGTGANATVGHGLGVAPSMIIIKNRSTVTDWPVYHGSNTTSPATQRVLLNTTDATATSSTYWNNTAPTSSVFSISTYSGVNGNTNAMVAYCFAPIAGYSAFGSYTGNGSTDGTFVYTGFRPRFVMVKSTSGPRNWAILDASRNPSNVANFDLYPNQSLAEVTQSTLDFLSNGFKLRVTDSDFNAAETYIYMAFAESPFKFSLGR